MDSRLAIGVAVAALFAAAPGAASGQDADAHIGHVMTAWPDAPDGRGLLATAEAEAEIARRHAALAVAEPDDLESIRLHIGHVLHAVDPSAIASGPGLGYGLELAAAGVAAHVGYAAGAPDATDTIKRHAERVAASARNVVTWSGEVVALAGQIMAGDRPRPAGILAGRVAALLDCIAAGCDADRDGTVGWGPGEGGLAQARAQMAEMMTAEGLR